MKKRKTETAAEQIKKHAELAFKGMDIKVKVCKGKTALQQIAEEKQRCPKCNGEGKILTVSAHKIKEYAVCPVCKGTRSVKKKPHKYHVGAKEKRTYNGVTYHSVLERKFAQYLDLRKLSDVREWERQIPCLLYAFNGEFWETQDVEVFKILKHKFIIDFKVTFKDGTIEYWEVKGWREGRKLKNGKRGKGKPYLHPGDALKIAIFKANHPELTFHIKTEKDLPHGF